MSMDNKKIQMSRMWKYFIDATVDIINEDGINQVTIRKVADRAGYNSATMYNYFGEVSHLIFFASMKLLKNYTEEVTESMKKGQTSLEKYLLAWECFCRYSFQQPAIFHAVFIMDLGDNPERMIERYYEMYPSDLINIPDGLKPILFERSTTKRGRSLLQLVARDGLIDECQVDSLNEMTNLLWQGMMTNILNNRLDYSLKEAEQKTLEYINEMVENALTKKIQN